MSPTQSEIQAFQMPSIKHGSVVAWYPTGKRGGPMEVAHVIRVAHRNVHLVTATKGVREAVRHVDDPKLQLNADQREMGAWDFTDWEKEQRKRVDELEEKIRRLESQMASLVMGAARSDKPRGNTKMNEYHQLWEEAKQMGISIEGRPTKSWLKRKIKECGDAEQEPEAETYDGSRLQGSEVSAEG